MYSITTIVRDIGLCFGNLPRQSITGDLITQKQAVVKGLVYFLHISIHCTVGGVCVRMRTHTHVTKNPSFIP